MPQAMDIGNRKLVKSGHVAPLIDACGQMGTHHNTSINVKKSELKSGATVCNQSHHYITNSVICHIAEVVFPPVLFF